MVEQATTSNRPQERKRAGHQQCDSRSHRRRAETHQETDPGARPRSGIRWPAHHGWIERTWHGIALNQQHPVVRLEWVRRRSKPVCPGVLEDSYFGPRAGLDGVTNPFWCIRRGLVGIGFSIKPAQRILPSLFRFAIPRACQSKASCPRGTYVSDVPFPRACPGAMTSNLQSKKGQSIQLYKNVNVSLVRPKC